MNKEKKQFYRDILNKQLEELLQEAGATVSTMAHKEDENFPDPSDRASMETDRNFLLRVKDRERKLISKVKEAIQRIEDNNYGICEICEEEISDKRLTARPVTTQCIACKTEAEETEKNKVKSPK